MKKNFFRALTFGILAIGMVSCKKDKAEPANVVEDATGLNISLNWAHTDGTDPYATDLDVYLYQGTNTTNEVAYSAENATFENFDVSPTLADGDYNLTVEHFTVSKNGTYTLTVKGKTVNKTYELRNKAFTTANDGQEISVLKISKSGNKFTFTNL